MRCVSARVRLQRCAYVVSCRPGGLQEELAVYRGLSEDFADACAYLVYPGVDGVNRVLKGWAKARAPEHPVDAVVPAGEGLLRPRGGVLPCVGAFLDLCVGGGDGPDPGLGPCGRLAPLDPLEQADNGQHQAVACPPRGDSGQGAGRGLVPRLEDAPDDPVWGAGLLYCPGGCGPWFKHGICPLDDPLKAGGCRGGHDVVLPALEDCTPDLRRRLVAVCRWWGGEGRRRGCGGRWRRGRCRGRVRWPVLIVPDCSGLPGGPSPLGPVKGARFLCV